MPSPLVGRDATLCDIRRAVRDAARGAGGCLVVEGPPGIGRSRLLRAACEEAAAIDVAVAAARATRLDRAAPLTTLLLALQRAQVPRSPSCLSGRPGDDRRDPVAVVRQAIEDYARTRPLVVALDDVHLVDELTSLALRTLVPASSSSPVLWLLARRPAPLRSPAHEAVDCLVAAGARRYLLGPLDEHAVAKVCSDILGATPDAATLALTSRCGGNPFLIRALLSALRASGQVHTAGGVATVGDDVALPPGFLTAVNKWLRGLSGGAHRLLEAASVLDGPFTLHQAAGLLGRSALDVLPAAGEMVEAGALVNVRSDLAFRHELVREAVFRGLPQPVRTALQREADVMVEAAGRSPIPDRQDHAKA